MDARELIGGWPVIGTLPAAGILAHPAWRLSVDCGGASADLFAVAPSETLSDELLVSVSLDGEPHVLGIADSAAFPDLHLLWSRRSELPDALVVALVEKEAGDLLQTVENVVRMELKVIGLVAAAETGARPPRRAFRLSAGGAEMSFSLDLPPETVQTLGVLDNLDTEHDAIRSLTRNVRAEYAAVPVADADIASLAVGDCLLLSGNAPSWVTEVPADDRLHVCSSGDETFTFAQFADETLPPVPPASALTLFRRGAPFAEAAPTTVGEAPAVKVTTLLPPSSSLIPHS